MQKNSWTIRKQAVYVCCFILILFGMKPQALAKPRILKLATTTSTFESGLLDAILPVWENKINAKVHIISVGTGKAIALGKHGDVDCILVHAREAEEQFIASGFGTNRRDVMYNDFLIAGPKSDRANARGSNLAYKALLKISKTQSTFISRGDDSGTHKKEKKLWEQALHSPKGKWYLEAGQGMSAALRMADQKNAYILVDRGTWITHKDKLRLTILVEGDKHLSNPYGIIAVNPKKHTHVKYLLAKSLIDWFVSPEGQKSIGDFQKNGEQLFYPSANKKNKSY